MQKAVRAGGFAGINIVRLNEADQTVFASRGNYGISMNCITGKQMVYLVVAGPTTKETDRLLQCRHG